MADCNKYPINKAICAICLVYYQNEQGGVSVLLRGQDKNDKEMPRDFIISCLEDLVRDYRAGQSRGDR